MAESELRIVDKTLDGRPIFEYDLLKAEPIKGFCYLCGSYNCKHPISKEEARKNLP